MQRNVTVCLAAATMMCSLGVLRSEEQCPVSDRARGHENTEWSIAYAYGLADETRDLPRVLLVGDSICNGYKDLVRERLKGKLNVS